jgi:hypothetical protein
MVDQDRRDDVTFAAVTGAGLVLALALAWGGLYMLEEDEAYRRTALEVRAVVVGHHETRQLKGNETRHTQWQDYRITTPEGHVVSYGVAISGHRPRLAIGQDVKALYQPSDPDDVRLDDGQERFMGRLLLGLSPTGLATSALGVYLWRRKRRLVHGSRPTVGRALSSRVK